MRTCDRKNEQNCFRRDVTAARASYILTKKKKKKKFDLNTPFRHVRLHGSHLCGGQECFSYGAWSAHPGASSRRRALNERCAWLPMDRQALATTSRAVAEGPDRKHRLLPAHLQTPPTLPPPTEDPLPRLVFVWRHDTPAAAAIYTVENQTHKY